MIFDHGFDAIVERAGGFDAEGIPVGGTQHTIGPCVRDRTGGVDVDGLELTVSTTEALYCSDPDADVRPEDVLVLPDGRWRVAGEVDRPMSPFDGWSPGCVIPIERVTGSIAPQPPVAD